MQTDAQRHQKLSRLRQELLASSQHLRQTIDVALARSPLIKGSVYQIARRCGNPHCRCTRGQLHRNFVLTWSEQGRHHMRSLPPKRVAEIRKKSKEYARLRQARSEITALCNRLLALLDQIQELRRETP
jgi:Family of unknown function (DUF6788)